jgi:hypothetical protein
MRSKKLTAEQKKKPATSKRSQSNQRSLKVGSARVEKVKKAEASHCTGYQPRWMRAAKQPKMLRIEKRRGETDGGVCGNKKQQLQP